MSPDLALTYCRMIAQTLELDETSLATLLEGTGVDGRRQKPPLPAAPALHR